MCGRTRVSMAPGEVAAAAGVSEGAWEGRERYRASHNVSPGHDTPVVRLSRDGSKQLHTMRWGLVPSFTKPTEQRPDHYRMMNARSETVAEKGVFRRLLERKRCLVPINGFYEWRQEAGKKQPYHVHIGEGTVMMLAGLYDCCWRRGSEGGGGSDMELRKGEGGGRGVTPGQQKQEEEEGLFTYTILTTDSSKPIRWLHDRMPVILRTPEAQEQWLRGDLAAAGGDHHQGPRMVLSAVCSPYQGEDLAAYPVTPAMNKATYQGSDACKELKRNTVMGMFARASGTTTATAKQQHGTPHDPGPSPGKPCNEEEEEEKQNQKHSDQSAGGVPSAGTEASAAAEAPKEEEQRQGEGRQDQEQQRGEREELMEEANKDERKRRRPGGEDEAAEAGGRHDYQEQKEQEDEGVTVPSGDGDARYHDARGLGAPAGGSSRGGGEGGGQRASAAPASPAEAGINKRPRTTSSLGSSRRSRGTGNNKKGNAAAAAVSPGDKKKKQPPISSFFARK